MTTTFKLLTEKYRDQIHGVLNCFDRLVLRGTLQQLCYAQGMTAYLSSRHIRIFDFAAFARPLCNRLCKHADELAKANNMAVEYVRKSSLNKEKRVQQILKTRGTHPGLVHIFSALESCMAYYPWYDKKTQTSFLKYKDGKCLHYYFYFIDDELGLCYLRVATWAPFRLQFYCNGHAILARALQRKHVAFEPCDNAFLDLADFDCANRLASRFNVAKLHRKLERFVKQYCPMLQALDRPYHWSIMQAEYATDIVFKRQKDLQALYPHLVETLIHSVKPENIASFLGQKLYGHYQGEMGNRFNVRIEGACLKHRMGPATIKMYDKYGIVLRLEVTVNDVSFFKQFREVRHRDGTKDLKWCKMRKSIYSLPALQSLLVASNQRYLRFLSAIETPHLGVARLEKLTTAVAEKQHRYKGFNFLAEGDAALMRLLVRGEFNITGFTCRDFRRLLPEYNSGQVSRLIKRLRMHGLIKKIGARYKYYLTELGKLVATTALKLRELVVIPQLAYARA